MIYVRPKVSREFALIHVIQRITAREITTRYLEIELKGIIRERDNIIEDRFDHLIKECTILDLEKHYTMDEFFRETSRVLAGEFALEEDALCTLLNKREAESSTVIRPGLAIPHIIVKGEDKFRILLARCKFGITFPGAPTDVHIVFVLAGTRDERNFHLRALAAIAEIAQDEDFDKKWLAAKNKHELRDIILLAERKRWKKK